MASGAEGGGETGLADSAVTGGPANRAATLALAVRSSSFNSWPLSMMMSSASPGSFMS